MFPGAALLRPDFFTFIAFHEPVQGTNSLSRRCAAECKGVVCIGRIPGREPEPFEIPFIVTVNAMNSFA
jgi:hypothetical protein